jgi:hypothetical protein
VAIVMKPGRNWVTGLIWLALLFPGLAGADLLGLRLYPRSSRDFVIGAPADDTMLQLTGFYGPEKTADGTPYRWSEGQASIGIRSFVAIPAPVLTVKLGAMPPSVDVPRPLQVAVNARPLVTLPATGAARRYELVLPATALRDGMAELGLATAPFHVAPDPRELGMRLDDLALSWPTAAVLWPSRQTVLVQWAMLLVVLASLRRLAAANAVVFSTAIGLLLLLGWAVGYEPFIHVIWETRVLAVALVACIVAWGLPLVLRATRRAFLSLSQ